MVPIYSVDSLLSLLLPSRAALLLNMLRDCYESYVLYLFLALMLAFLGSETDGINDADDYAALKALEKLRPDDHDPSTDGSYGKIRLRYFKFGVLQYCIIRPLMTSIGIILEFSALYHESNFSVKYGYLYVTMIINYSACYALYVLAQFYGQLGGDLKPYDPVSKFLCLKFIIFFVFWQSVVLAILVRGGWLTTIGDYGTEDASRAIQDFLICMEMVIVSISMHFAFPYRPYTPEVMKLALFDRVVSPMRDSFIRRGECRTESENKTFTSFFMRDTSNSSNSAREPINYFGLEEPIRNKRGGTAYSKLVMEGSGIAATDDDEENMKYHEGDDEINDIVLVTLPNTNSTQSQQRGYHSKPHKEYLKSSVLVNSTFSSSSSSSSSSSFTSSTPSSARDVINKNFSTDTVVRDFNQMLLPVLIPTGFQPSKGTVVHSNPMDRVKSVDRKICAGESECVETLHHRRSQMKSIKNVKDVGNSVNHSILEKASAEDGNDSDEDDILFFDSKECS